MSYNLHKLRKPLSKFWREINGPFGTLISHLCHGSFRRPYVISTGIIFSFLVLIIIIGILSWIQYSKGDTLELAIVCISLSIGLSGLIYSLLSYNTALKVETSIRDSITDIRIFVQHANEILDRAIRDSTEIYYHSKSTKDISKSRYEIILVLWFPCFNLTSDLNSIGPHTTRNIIKIKKHDCRTHIISAQNPLELFKYFDKRYKDSTKQYDSQLLFKTLEKLPISAPGNEQRITECIRILESIIQESGIDKSDNYKAHQLYSSLKDISEIIQESHTGNYTVSLHDAKTLMSCMFQAVWTPRQAIIVFMPPEDLTKGSTESDKDASTNHPYSCYGFSTQDPYMLNMIYNLIKIRFELPD